MEPIASKSVLDTLWDSMIVLLAVLIGVGSVAGLELVAEQVVGVGLGPIGPVASLIGLFVAFTPIYVVFPEHRVSPRDALPGIAFATVGWFLLSYVFAVYSAIAGEYAAYGAVGAVLLVLIWLYAGAGILVTGAIINAVLANVDGNRQVQSPGERQLSTMADDAMVDDDPDADTDGQRPSEPGPDATTRDRIDDPAVLREEIQHLEERLESFENDVEQRTVKRQSLEAELKRYVRRRVRRGHATGWGPYLVLLYGTAMTVAAFYFLAGGWAILAMLVVWTSTLGVYVLMVIFGTGLTVLGIPGRLRNRFSEWRS